MTFLRDLAGRVGSTFAQVLLVAVLAGGTATILDGQTWKVAVPAALFSAALALISSVVAKLFSLDKLSPQLDLVRRVVLTFLQAFGGTLIAAGVTDAFDADWKGAAALALPVAGVALGKAFLGLLDKSKPGAGLSVSGLAEAAKRF